MQQTKMTKEQHLACARVVYYDKERIFQFAATLWEMAARANRTAL